MSWKTTLGGAITALGVSLMAAAQLDWTTAAEKHTFLLIGFILMALGTFLTGLFARDNDKTSEQVRAGQAKAPGLSGPAVLLVAFLLLAGSVAGIVTLTGCQSPPQRIAYNAVDAPAVTVQQGLKLWDDWVGTHDVPVEQIRKVQAAYQKWQACAKLEWDAAHAYSQCVGTTNSAAALLKSQLASGNASQAAADFLALLRAFGVKV